MLAQRRSGQRLYWRERSLTHKSAEVNWREREIIKIMDRERHPESADRDHCTFAQVLPPRNPCKGACGWPYGLQPRPLEIIIPPGVPPLMGATGRGNALGARRRCRRPPEQRRDR